MPLLDRVAALIRANLNDLIDKAEDPEKLLKQLLLDMQNQYMQVKTQTAIAIADQHMLETKKTESIGAQSDLLRKAELALGKGDEQLARAALERSLVHETAASNFGQQIGDQGQQVASLRESLSRLEAKMEEARVKMDLLIARHRRARLALQVGVGGLSESQSDQTFDRLRNKVSEAEALGVGYSIGTEPGALARLDDLEKRERVETLIAELKRKNQKDQ